MSTTAGHLLSIYSVRKKMQEKGTTNPSQHVKDVTNRLVEKLSELKREEKIEIEIEGSFSRFIRKASGEVLAELKHEKTYPDAAGQRR